MDDFISVQFTHCYYQYSDKNRVSMVDSVVLSNGVGDSSSVLCSHQWTLLRHCGINKKLPDEYSWGFSRHNTTFARANINEF